MSLIGMPMSGKSTVGRIVADMLHKEFVDVDKVIEKKADMAIPEIFERFKEAGFRELEREAVKEVSAKRACHIDGRRNAPLVGKYPKSPPKWLHCLP